MNNSSLIKWKEISGYRTATSLDFKYPQKLRYYLSASNELYTNSGGNIWRYNPESNTWSITSFPYVPSLFLIQIPKKYENSKN